MDDKLSQTKARWLRQDFLGGAILCAFLSMQDRKLDIIYDKDHPITQEYITLLKKRLETDHLSLLLMVNTEIENCCIGMEEPLYPYLKDEIYEHLKNSHHQYPIQAIGLHIDIIHALIQLKGVKKAYHYLYRLRETNIEVFGENSYFFCRNWCYILNEILLIYSPDIAVKAFNDCVDTFSSGLREETIFYHLSINIAVQEERLGKKEPCIKKAIHKCDLWCRQLPPEKQTDLQIFTRNTAALHYKHIGEYETALKLFEESVALSPDIRRQLPVLSQIAYILYVKHDIKQLHDFFTKNQFLMDKVQEPDLNIALLYSFYGFYCIQTGDYTRAQDYAKKAVETGRQLCAEDSDSVIQLRNNETLIKYYTGKLEEAAVENQELLNLVSLKPEKYPESLPLILNNLIVMSSGVPISSGTIQKMRHILELKNTKDDISSTAIFKCNLYSFMMAYDAGWDEKELEELRTELHKYYTKYPCAEGIFPFLCGEFCRFQHKNNRNESLRILKKIKDFLELKQTSIFSREYLIYFVSTLKIFIYENDYISAKNQLLSLWEKVLFPLFHSLAEHEEENSETPLLLLRPYLSLLVSAVRQYPQLKITDTKLYEYVLNFKYFVNLYCYKPEQFAFALKNGKWLSIKNIPFDKEALIAECFCYTKYNWESPKIILGAPDSESVFPNHNIYFVLFRSPSWNSEDCAEVIGDISSEELYQEIIAVFDTEELSSFEIQLWNQFQPFMKDKEKLYLCTDIFTTGLPFALLRINENCYWGEKYQIIYCTTGMDMKDEPEIQNFSNSIFYGKSVFKNLRTGSSAMQKQLTDLPYAKSEVEKLGTLTGGSVLLDMETKTTWRYLPEKEIIHFATHTTQDEEDGRKALIIGEDSCRNPVLLKCTDIAQQNWKNTKLIVFSSCETSGSFIEHLNENEFRQAAKEAGVSCSISTVAEVDDGANTFFMVCFYKKLLLYKKVSKAFFETLKTLQTITTQEILADPDYLDIGMDHFLQNFENNSVPFASPDNWATYILQING